MFIFDKCPGRSGERDDQQASSILRYNQKEENNGMGTIG